MPSGVWTIDVVGLDLSNTVYLHFPYPVCGINADGTSSCPPIYGSIGDRVWKDMNANGVQDSGEPNFPGVTVNLLNSSGAVIATKTTDANGNYLFDNLAAGDYKVQFVKPGGYVFTQQYAQGPDASMSNNNDSNPYPTGGSAGMTDTIRLGVGQNNLTIDAGLYQLAALGDFVWEDKNGNGIQDDGANSGIGGVTVKLYDGQNNFLGETTTAADGSYHFTNLPPGQYYVVFFKPDGYSFTTQYASGNPAASNDSNANVVTGKSDLIILNPGDNNITIDAGLYRPAALGDFVWFDSNGNGKQDGGEPGVAGATVTLLNADGTAAKDINGVLVPPQVTPSTGLYQFTNLAPGSYIVQFVAPNGYTFTQYLQGTDTAIDSNANPANSGKTGTITLVSGQTDNTWDAGLVGSLSLGDYVWVDTNGNGIQDDGNTGINGLTVQLLGSNGTTVLATTTTANNTSGQPGYYLFSNLVPGTYYVQFTAPSGYVYTTKYVNGSGSAVAGNDSNADTTSGKTDAIALNADGTVTINGANGTSGSNLGIDAGLKGTLSLGDYVWVDTNGNGIQDDGNTGINGLTVQLLGSNGTSVLATTTTANNTSGQPGYYLFSNLVPGTYYVQFTAPSGYVYTAKYVNGSGSAVAGNDSNADTTSGKTDAIALNANGTVTINGAAGAAGSNLGIDAGLYKPAALGDFVWNDGNGDGMQVTNSVGIAGVTVKLLDSGGNVIRTTTTDANGKYLFSNLAPGTYSVEFVKPAGYIFTIANAGTNDTIDSDANATTPNAATAKTGTYTLVSGETNLTVDAGVYQPASLGDYVWEDKNSNGLQDSGEPGIAGVTVKLLGSDGTTVLKTTTTDANGKYLFSDLAVGTYYVLFVQPTGYTGFTMANVGTNDAIDSDANTSTGRTGAYTLTAGQSNLTVDAGLKKTTTFVCVDNLVLNPSFELNTGSPPTNWTNGTAGDIGIYVDGKNVGYISGSGVMYQNVNVTPGYGYTLTFYSGSHNPQNQTVKLQYYNASNVALGTAAVHTITSDLQVSGFGGPYTLTLGAAPTDAKYLRISVSANGYDYAKVDAFCLQAQTAPQTASLGDYVWKDTNGNGVQDSGEPGISGVTVKLLAADGTTVLATTTTDASGKYLFSNLAAGTYSVQFVKPATGYTGFTTANAGSDDGKDSDADTNGKTGAYTLTAGQSNLTVDAGLKPTTSWVCVDNLVLNPSFELNTGTPPTNWTNGTAGDIGIYVDGKNVGYISGSGVMYQNVNVTPGYGYTLTFYSGSHVPQDQTVKLQYYNASNVALGTAVVHTITSDLEVTGFGGPYTLTLGAAPTDAKYLRISVSANGHDYAKVDALCLKAQPGTPPPSAPGTGTPGYWMNHPEAWPSNSITIGGKTYTKADAINLMKAPTSTDMTYQMFQHLVAAKLNVAVGNTATCISSGITAADDWMKAHPVGSGVAASSTAWQSISATFTALDNYNNGRLCAPSRG